MFADPRAVSNVADSEIHSRLADPHKTLRTTETSEPREVVTPRGSLRSEAVWRVIEAISQPTLVSLATQPISSRAINGASKLVVVRSWPWRESVGVVWRIVEATERQLRAFAQQRGRERRGRFLVDENVDPIVATYLRDKRYNTRTAEEAGLCGRADREVFQSAWKGRRILVTHDGRDFWNDREFPLEQTHGVAILAGGQIGPLFYVALMFGTSAETWAHHKIRFVADGSIAIKSRKRTSGAVTVTRYRFTDGSNPEVWEDEG